MSVQQVLEGYRVLLVVQRVRQVRKGLLVVRRVQRVHKAPRVQQVQRVRRVHEARLARQVLRVLLDYVETRVLRVRQGKGDTQVQPVQWVQPGHADTLGLQDHQVVQLEQRGRKVFPVHRVVRQVQQAPLGHKDRRVQMGMTVPRAPRVLQGRTARRAQQAQQVLKV
jgi:hypothetical protein